MKGFGSYLVWLFGLGALALGQAPTGIGLFKPDRGFMPYGTYALTDMEAINDYSGGVILKVPLASLPQGRGGMSAGLSLVYNSQLFDIKTGASTNTDVLNCNPPDCDPT